jgi:hypothetical protein
MAKGDFDCTQPVFSVFSVTCCVYKKTSDLQYLNHLILCQLEAKKQ